MPIKSDENKPQSTFVAMTEEEIRASNVGEVVPLNGRVELCAYDPDWPLLFERERARIASTLGDRALLIEHVGSTVVPGLAAKPRIDILLVVANSGDESSYVPDLESAGYELRIREPDWHEHRVFKGPDTDINLHTFSPGSVEIERMLGFRDWLRTHDDDRRLYQDAKYALASQEWQYIQNYADAKTDVIEEIRRRAGLPDPMPTR